MVLYGKDKALEFISQSSTVFIARLTHVQRTFSSVSMPPIDHYRLQFDRQHRQTLRGRVYETMIDFDYAQVNDCRNQHEEMFVCLAWRRNCSSIE